jgi:hypothetical protein
MEAGRAKRYRSLYCDAINKRVWCMAGGSVAVDFDKALATDW